jgi:hypothetical protein
MAKLVESAIESHPNNLNANRRHSLDTHIDDDDDHNSSDRTNNNNNNNNNRNSDLNDAHVNRGKKSKRHVQCGHAKISTAGEPPSSLAGSLTSNRGGARARRGSRRPTRGAAASGGQSKMKVKRK